jgi:hypothetical protein
MGIVAVSWEKMAFVVFDENPGDIKFVVVTEFDTYRLPETERFAVGLFVPIPTFGM